MTKHYEHDDNFRIPGTWWFSDDKDNQITGDLLLNERKLVLNGSFDGIQSRVYGISKPGLVSARKDRTIQGVARNGGKHYTLEYYDNPSFTMSMPGYKSDTYSLGNMFEGIHFEETESLKFTNYYVELPYLFEWVNESIIAVETTFKQGESLSIQESAVKIFSPKEIPVFTDDGMDISFVIYRGALKMSPPLKNIQVSQGCVLKIKSHQGLSLIDAWGIVRHIERLLSIAVGRSLDPIKFDMSMDGQKKVALILKMPIQSVYKDIYLSEMNFTYTDIADDSQAVFKKWFDDKVKHNDMFDIFSSINTGDKNLNNNFRDIVSAVEGYVSVESGRLDVSPDKAVKTLNEKLPKSDRPISVDDYRKIRVTRNKLSHLTLKPEDEPFVLDNNGKWVNANRMKFLLEYALLKSLCVSDSILSKFYNNRRHYL